MKGGIMKNTTIFKSKLAFDAKKNICAGKAKASYRIPSTKLFASSICISTIGSFTNSILELVAHKNLIDNDNSYFSKLPFQQQAGFVRFGADINKTAFSQRM